MFKIMCNEMFIVFYILRLTATLNLADNSYYYLFSVVLVFSMLDLGRILISDLVVTNLLMYSLPVMILLYLVVTFFTPKVFLDEISSLL